MEPKVCLAAVLLCLMIIILFDGHNLIDFVVPVHGYVPPMMGKIGGSDKKYVAPSDVSRTTTSHVIDKQRAYDYQGQLQGTDMMRIRINSQAVLGHLTSLLGETERRSTPRTFIRPFKPLVYYQQKMKDILDALEEKWGDVEDVEEDYTQNSSETAEELEFVEDSAVEPANTAAQDEETADDTASDDDEDYDDSDRESLKSVDSNAEDQEIIMDGVQALRDMRCYVDFVEKEVMPLYNQYSGTSATKVRYEDLWSLFRVGDLIYMPASNDNSGRYHELWRVYRIKSPQPDSEYSFAMAGSQIILTHRDTVKYPRAGYAWLEDFREDDNEDEKFTICAYYIDHDGAEFGAVRHKFFIDSFPGERPIDSLEVFPIRFAENHEQIIESHKKQGKDFTRYLSPKERHQAYNAWTVTRNPPHDPYDYNDRDAEVLRNEDGQYWRHPEYVESDVIVDMNESFQRNSDWRPTFHRPKSIKPVTCNFEEDEMKVQQWMNGSRSRLAFAQTEIIQMTDGIELRQRREHLTVDSFLSQRVRNSDRSSRQVKSTEPTDLCEEDLVLLPKRMFAYVLRERRFVPIDINFLKPIRREQGVFENLRILQDYKDIVRGLVGSHFEKKTIERKYIDIAAEGPSQDLIQGKGRGLVVLLHGVPGVGKTATAEAVAMENQKPLFVITCGDLGLSPSEVERSLTNVFRLAHMWDCVLLLDEADVFLSQRAKQDMKRNALVSVFLRVLEYYNGILFLTTNRVGTIDDAFRSRIHMSLYYPPLDKAQTRDIFRLNVTKLREIESQRHQLTGEPAMLIKEAEIVDFASRHYEEHARLSGCWNGRQIRNAFQITSSLARHNYTDQMALAKSRGQQGPAAPVLDRSLFEKVQMSTQSFERHMRETRGGDMDLALRNTFQQDKFD